MEEIKRLPKSVINQIKKQAISAAQNEEIATRVMKQTEEKIEEFVTAQKAKCESERHVIAYTSALDVIHKLTGDSTLDTSDILEVFKVDTLILGKQCRKTEYKLKDSFIEKYMKQENKPQEDTNIN